MFGLFGKKKSPENKIRETLFGDMPIEVWAASPTSDEPWATFFKVRKAIESGSKSEAVSLLSAITGLKDVEPRVYLQAWHFLRQLGVNPPPEIYREVHGVVVEVGMKNGLDLVAGYANHSARYYNYSGAGVVWERPDPSLDPFVSDLLIAGKRVVEKIGLWEGPRPGAPEKGEARINMLTPAGLWFGQAPINALSADEIGGPVVKSALKLMQALIEKSESSKA